MRNLEKNLTKNFIFFAIPILISILSFIHTKYIEIESEKNLKLTLINAKIKEDLRSIKIIKNKYFFLSDYINQYQHIIQRLQHRTILKEHIVKNIKSTNNDSISKKITQLRTELKQISSDLGDNLVFSDDNFEFNSLNKNLTILLQTEYDQHKELLNNIHKGKISDKYSDFDNKLLTYINASSLSSRDSLNILDNFGLKTNYDNDNISTLKNGCK